MRGPFLACLGLLCVAGWAAPHYKYEVITPLLAKDGGSRAFIYDFEDSGKVVYGGLGVGSEKWYWDGSQVRAKVKLLGFQVNSAGEMTYDRVCFRRSWDAAPETVPFYNGHSGDIRGINDLGEVYGNYPLNDGLYGEMPFIYNIRTGELRIPPKPDVHIWSYGRVVKMDNFGRYVLAGVSGGFDGNTIEGATFVDGNYQTRIPLNSSVNVFMNDVGGIVSSLDSVKPVFTQLGVSTNLDWNPGHSISNDNIIPIHFQPAIPTLELWQIEGKSYQKYKIHDVTPSLPSDFKVYHAHIRPDGAMAAMAERGGKFYLLKFTPVPEPATLTVLGLGFAASGRRRRIKVSSGDISRG